MIMLKIEKDLKKICRGLDFRFSVADSRFRCLQEAPFSEML